MKRKEPLVTDNIYHVLNKSIAGYVIFNSHRDYQRMLWLFSFFSLSCGLPKFSRFIEKSIAKGKIPEKLLKEKAIKDNLLIQIIAYCIMPTHIHLILKQLKNNGISTFMGNISNSYARYFNSKYKRRGHLWENTFKNISITSDRYLLHLSRYIHLNPVTVELVNKAKQWQYSSYNEYISQRKNLYCLCKFHDLIDISTLEYQKFVNNRADYQKELAKIKKFLLE